MILLRDPDCRSTSARYPHGIETIAVFRRCRTATANHRWLLAKDREHVLDPAGLPASVFDFGGRRCDQGCCRYLCKCKDDFFDNFPLWCREIDESFERLAFAIANCLFPSGPSLVDALADFFSEAKVLGRHDEPFCQRLQLVLIRHGFAEKPTTHTVQCHRLAPITQIELTFKDCGPGLITRLFHRSA
jgi:hypothetical protein